jgi:hypothetical protein
MCKPITSRPASAERYLICNGFHGNPIGWDGPKWCSNIFLGRISSGTTHSTSTTTDNNNNNNSTDDISFTKLHAYLNEFDCNMYKLNIKACFTILTYLETKYNSSSVGDYDSRGILQNQNQITIPSLSSSSDNDDMDDDYNDDHSNLSNNEEHPKHQHNDNKINIEAYKHAFQLI